MIRSKAFVVWDSEGDMAVEFKHGEGESTFVRLTEGQAASLADQLASITSRRYERRHDERSADGKQERPDA